MIDSAPPAGSAPRGLSHYFGIAARLGLAIGLTAYLLWKVHPQEIAAAIARARWPPVAAALFLVLIDRTLMAYRWVALLCTIEPDRRPRLGELMRIFFVSTFAGTILPGLAGDAARSYETAKLNVPAADAVASVFMDRILGVSSVLVMALLGLVLARELASSTGVLLALGASAILCAATMALVFSRRVGRLVSAVAVRFPLAVVRRVGVQLIGALARYAGHSRALAAVLTCSVLVQILRILQAYLLGLSLGISAPLLVYFAFIPLILLVMLLPVTYNGIGTGQAVFVWAFRHAGVGEPEAFALSVLFIALGIAGNLPGALLYVAGRRGTKK